MNHSIIKDLFYGDISALEEGFSPQIAEQKAVLRQMDALLKGLLEKLAPEDQKKLEEFDLLQGQLSLMDEEKSFAYGLRLGVLLMCEIFLPREGCPGGS